MLVSEEGVRREVPHEPGEWFDFKRLSAGALKRAGRAKAADDRKETAELIRSLGPAFLKAMREQDEDGTRAVIRQIEELEFHPSNYDEGILLKEGIKNTSYEVDVTDEVDWLEILDAKTARWAAGEVINITRPPNEEEEGNS